jgi:UDP-N-acetylmuramoyl-L-alanyl-D-glutamate--2,6-diaminopimelate ligase
MFQKVKNLYHLIQAKLACIYYGHPAKKLKVIGITGTDGKTTTSSLIYSILKNAGLRVSIITSVNAIIGNKSYDTGFHVTTPSPFFLQKMLKYAVSEGSDYFILEVTSHAIDQNRIAFILFEIGVLTNITKEHLDYHESYQTYLETKTQFLGSCKKAIINSDDDSYKNVVALLHNTLSKDKIIMYGTKNAEYTFKNCMFVTTLPGEYNKSNCLAAFSCTNLLGVNEETIRKSIRDFRGVKGRYEIIKTKGKPTVIIDFAHTPNALFSVLRTVKKEIKKGRLIHVFGCAGLRDFQKRPVMGEYSAKFADSTVITEEDYRTEKLVDINASIIEGINNHEKRAGKKHTYTVIDNRKDAIMYAVSHANPDDTIILTGKGHEQSLCRGKKEYPWDERKAVEKALNHKSKIKNKI